MPVLPIRETNPTVQAIEKDIEDYKAKAKVVASLLREVEVYRNRLINEIEEAEYNGKIGKRVASRLEDKLIRPYAMDLYKL